MSADASDATNHKPKTRARAISQGKVRASLAEIGHVLSPILASVDRLERDAQSQAAGQRVRCHRLDDDGPWHAEVVRQRLRGWLKRQKALLANGSKIPEDEFNDFCASRDVLRRICGIRNSCISREHLARAIRKVFLEVDRPDWQPLAPGPSSLERYRFTWRSFCAILYDAANPKPSPIKRRRRSKPSPPE